MFIKIFDGGGADMSHTHKTNRSVTAKTHQFALDAMVETTAGGILSKVMKALASTTVDAVGLSIIDDTQDRYLFSSRGAVSADAKDRIRQTLDALSRDEDTGVLLPVIQTPCSVKLSNVARIEQTFEGWYRRFNVAGQQVTLVAFHAQQTIVDKETRAILMQLSRVLEATLVMLNHKQHARISLVDGPQILLNVNIDGIESIRGEFGDFEAEEMLSGIGEAIRVSLDAVSHIGQANEDTLSVMLPHTDKTLLNQIKLQIAETIRFYPAPSGYTLDAQIRANTMTAASNRSNVAAYSLRMPSMPATPAVQDGSIAQ
jgi:hypothetical protein